MSFDLGSEPNAVLCEFCGYDLRGLDRCRCPECGTDFDLDELRARQAAMQRASWTRFALHVGYAIGLMFACTVLSIAIQQVAYSARTGPRSREWIVHNLPAPAHYLCATVYFPEAMLVAGFTYLLLRYLRRGFVKTSMISAHWQTVMMFLIVLAFGLLAQLGCLFEIATMGD